MTAAACPPRLQANGRPIMDAKYVLGIAEIDAQHEEIVALVKSLRKVISKNDQRHLIHPAIKRLHHLLVTHFAYEESLMEMVNSAELPTHRKMHRGVLQLFDDYFDHPPEPGDYEPLGKLIGDKVLGHVMDHDLHMAESVRQYLVTFRSPGVAKPKRL